MKPEIPPTIVDPCPIAWNEMDGSGKRRFCEHCQLHVHNLSEMSARERSGLLIPGDKLCVTYIFDSAGALVTRGHGVTRLFARMRAAFLAVAAVIVPLGSSSAGRQIMGKPLPPKNTVCPTPTPAPPVPPHPPMRGAIAIPPEPPPKP